MRQIAYLLIWHIITLKGGLLLLIVTLLLASLVTIILIIYHYFDIKITSKKKRHK